MAHVAAWQNSNNSDKPREDTVTGTEDDMKTATQHPFIAPGTKETVVGVEKKKEGTVYSCLEMGKIYMNPFTVQNAKTTDLIYQGTNRLYNTRGNRTWDISRLVITTDGSVYFMPRLYSCYRYDEGDWKRNYFDVDYYTTVLDEENNKWEMTDGEKYAFIIDQFGYLNQVDKNGVVNHRVKVAHAAEGTIYSSIKVFPGFEYKGVEVSGSRYDEVYHIYYHDTKKSTGYYECYYPALYCEYTTQSGTTGFEKLLEFEPYCYGQVKPKIVYKYEPYKSGGIIVNFGDTDWRLQAQTNNKISTEESKNIGYKLTEAK